MTTEAATQTEEVPEAKDVSEKEATIVEADIDVEDNKNEEKEEEEEKLIQIADNMADMSSEDKSDSAIIPVDPHNIEIPTIRSISIKDFKAFFGSRDFAPSIPFPWAIYQKLRATAPNIVELIRTSCSAISGHSKYIDINYSYLAEYANIVCKKQEAIRVKMIKKMKMNEKKEEESEEDEIDEICKFQAKLERMKLSERDIINLLCLFVTLQFGSGFHNHNNKKQRNEIISIGIQNMYKIYGSLTTKTLNNIEWTIDSISELFEINYEKSLPLKSLCDMIRKCIEEIIHILSLKDFTDFAAYVYYHIDLAWIKSQTKELSALQDVEWILNQSGKLGLELAPTKSNNVRRCVVVGFNGGIDNPKHLNKLVENRAFIYAINDQVVYNLKFNQIIHKIKEICNESTEPNYYVDNIENDNNNQEKKRFITIQFGLHLDREPNTVQALLFNFINDFPCLNDQYLYKSVFGNNKNLRIYLFQKVQLIVQELYNNLYKKKNIRIFNFKDINSLVPLGHNIPFVLLNENVIKLKDEFKNEFEQYIDDQYILKASDLEVEMRASSLWAIELLSTKYNVHGLTNYLSNRGECNEYKNHRRHYVRDTVYY